MVLFNYGSKEITAKIVYYGPGLCGKTTNLQFIYKKVPTKTKGKMISLATKSDRTLFFDFLPLDLGTIGGLRTRFQLYTVPGQVFYNSTRKLVLKGADSVVFVADSQKRMMPANIESFENLKDNLKDEGLNIQNVPLVMQYNKRDLTDISTIEELNKKLNIMQRPYIAACATTGDGVLETLKMISKLTLELLTKKYRSKKSVVEPAKPSVSKPSTYVKIDKPVTESIRKSKPGTSNYEETAEKSKDGIAFEDPVKTDSPSEIKEKISTPIEPPKESALIEEDIGIGGTSDIPEPNTASSESEQAKAAGPSEKCHSEISSGPQNAVIAEEEADLVIDNVQEDKNVIKKEITAPISIPKGMKIKDIRFDITLNIKVVTEDE